MRAVEVCNRSESSEANDASTVHDRKVCPIERFDMQGNSHLAAANLEHCPSANTAVP